MAALKPKAKDLTRLPAPNPNLACSTFPLWDDNQIAMENWGSSLSAVTRTASVGPRAEGIASLLAKNAKDTRASKGMGNKDLSGPGEWFVDVEGRAALASFLNSELAKTFAREEPAPLCWERPVDLSKPFRPLVHLNATPFVDPYAPPELLRPVETAQEENRSAAFDASLFSNGSSATQKRSKNQSTTTPEPTLPFYQHYPEAVSVKKNLVGQDWSSWQSMKTHEAIQWYRQMQVLMEPYDPTLISGCAETPAEACGSRYSTNLRHKLMRAEQLAALDQMPPFLMSAFNSVLMVIQCSQHLIPKYNYLWELIYPHAPGTCHPVYNPFGKYAVKLFIKGSYRKVVVDDALLVDSLGRPFFTVTSCRELWPAILFKAVFKAIHAESNDAAGLLASHIVKNLPDTLLSYLVGNWVPSYLKPSQIPVESAALLVEWRRSKSTSQSPCTQSANQDTHLPIPSEQSKTAKDAHVASQAAEVKTARQAGGVRITSKSDAERDKNVSVFGIVPQMSDSVGHTDLSEVADIEPVARSAIICGLRRACPAYPASRPVAQLYALVEVVSFRDTLAVCLMTTPRTVFPRPGVFQREPEAIDVCDILASAASEPSSNANPSVSRCWLTFEELCEFFETLVVFRCYDKRYPNQVVLEGATTAGPILAALAAANPASQSPASGTLKKQARGKSLPSPPQPLVPATDPPGGPKIPTSTPVVAWLSVKCEQDEEVAVVVQSGKREMRDRTWLSEGNAPGNEGSTLVGTSCLVEAPSDGEGPVLNGVLTLEYFHWDLAEPLTSATTISYRTGEISSSQLYLTSGQHVFCVTVQNMRVTDRITFMSHGTLGMKADLSELLKEVDFSYIVDTGLYPALEHADEEMIWFKRVLKLSSPTCVTAVLSISPSTEDAALHPRKQPLGAPNGLALKGSNTKSALLTQSSSNTNVSPRNGTGVVATHGVGGGNASLSAKYPLIEDGDSGQAPGDSILQFTKLMLINLDDGSSVICGDHGRLVRQCLELNQRGYMMLAYAYLSRGDMQSLEVVPEDAIEEEQGKDFQASLTPRDSASPSWLNSKGTWKLHIRSDKKLLSLDAVPITAVQIFSGFLQRGGSTRLFCKNVTLSEPTHISLVLSLSENYFLPFKLRIWACALKESDDSTPATAGRTPTMPGLLPSTREILLYESLEHFESCRSAHLFVPNLLLDPRSDKPRIGVFCIEAVTSPADTQKWNDFCIQVRSDYFNQQRQEMEAAVEKRVEEDIKEISDHPSDFIQRKLKEQQEMQHHGQNPQKQTWAGENGSSGRERGANPAAGGPASRRSRSAEKKKAGSGTSLKASVLQVLNNMRPEQSIPNVSQDRQALVQSASSNNPTLPLSEAIDASADPFAVSYNLHLFSSSVKLEVKPAKSSEDIAMNCIKRLRGAPHSEDVPMGVQDGVCVSSQSSSPPTSIPTPRPGTMLSAFTVAKTASRHHRPELIPGFAGEEQMLRVERGKACRESFLKNPQNVLIPYVEVAMESGSLNNMNIQPAREAPRLSLGARGARNVNSAGSSSAAGGMVFDANSSSVAPTDGSAPKATIVYKDSEANDFPHARPLHPSEYSIRLLPLRASEECPPLRDETPQAVQPPPPPVPTSTKDTNRRGNRASNLHIGALAAVTTASNPPNKAGGGAISPNKSTTKNNCGMTGAGPGTVSESGSVPDPEVAESMRALSDLVRPITIDVACDCQKLRLGLKETRNEMEALVKSYWSGSGEQNALSGVNVSSKE